MTVLAGCAQSTTHRAPQPAGIATSALSSAPLSILTSSITPSGTVYVAAASPSGSRPTLLRYSHGSFRQLAYLPGTSDLLDFVGDGRGWVLDRSTDRLFRAIAGGRRLEPIASLSRFGSAIALGFATPQRGWAVLAESSRTVVATTRDGGYDWELLQVLPSQLGAATEAVIDPSTASTELLVGNGTGVPPELFVLAPGAARFTPTSMASSLIAQLVGFGVIGGLQVVDGTVTVAWEPVAPQFPVLPLRATTPAPRFVAQQPRWFASRVVAFSDFAVLADGTVVAISANGIYTYTPAHGWVRTTPSLLPTAIFDAAGTLGTVGIGPHGNAVVLVGTTPWRSTTLRNLLANPYASVLGLTPDRQHLIVALQPPTGPESVLLVSRTGSRRAIPLPRSITAQAGLVAAGQGAIAASTQPAPRPAIKLYLAPLARSLQGHTVDLGSIEPSAILPLSSQQLWIAATQPVVTRASPLGSPSGADYLAFSADAGRTWTNVAVGDNDVDAIDFGSSSAAIATLSPYASPSFWFLVRVERVRGTMVRIPVPAIVHGGFAAVFGSPTSGWLLGDGLGRVLATTDAGAHWSLVHY